MKKDNIWKIILIMLVVAILPPALIAIGVTVHLPVMDKINDSSGWIGFWGSYVGALITSLGAYGLWLMQRESDKKREVLPTINVCQINGVRPQTEENYYIDYLYWKQKLSGWVLNDPQHKEVKQEVEKRSKWFHTCILVQSIGKGTAMNLQVDIEGKKHIDACDQFAICLKEGESARYDIYVEAENLKISPQKNELFFRFKDVYENKYEQSIKFGVHDLNEITRNEMPQESVVPVEWQLTYFDPISSLREVKD